MFARFYSSIINNSIIITKLYRIWWLLNTHEEGAGDWSRVFQKAFSKHLVIISFRISLQHCEQAIFNYDIIEFMIWALLLKWTNAISEILKLQVNSSNNSNCCILHGNKFGKKETKILQVNFINYQLIVLINILYST